MGCERMSCEFGNWGCEIGEAVGQWASGATGQALVAIAEALADGLGQLVQALGTMWVGVPTPELVVGAAGADIQQPTDGLMVLLNWSSWLALIVCVLSLIGLGATLGSPKGSQPVRRLGSILLAVVLVSGAGSVVGLLITSASEKTAQPSVAFIHDSLQPVVVGMAVLSLLIAAMRVAWEQRADGARRALSSMITLVVVAGGGLSLVAVLVATSDALATEILARSTAGSNFEENLFAMLGLAHAATGGSGVLIVIVLGTVALLGSIVQIALMVLRSGMLVLLAGILPLSASFTNTSVGSNWFRKCAGWLLAFILYKPAAALIYATAFQLVGTDLFAGDATGLWASVTGVAMMIMALLALPALMRFVAPVVALQSAAAGMGASLARAGGEVPTGAIRAFRVAPPSATPIAAGPATTGAASGSGSAVGGGVLGGAASAAPALAPAAAAAAAAGIASKAAAGVRTATDEVVSGSGARPDMPGQAGPTAPPGSGGRT